MKKDLTIINQNSKLVLAKSKNLLNITKNILAKKDASALTEYFPLTPFVCHGYTSSVESVEISPDGKYIVSGSLWTIKIWDLKSGECLNTLEGNTSSVIAISPDGKYIVFGSFLDDTIKIWDLKSGECLNTLEGNTPFAKSVAISPDGKYIVFGSLWDDIKIWDLKSGECLNTLEGHTSSVESVEISPDGKYIVSGSNDSTIKIWDLKSGECLNTLEGHTDLINSVAISPDGKYIVSGSNDSTIKIWDLKSGEYIYSIYNYNDFIAIDNKANFIANDKAIEKHLRVSEKPLSVRKLTPKEIEHFRKKDGFLSIGEPIKVESF